MPLPLPMCPAPLSPADPTIPAGRFLSRAECADLFKRATRLAEGGGTTAVFVESRWEANVRWARNQVTTSGDIRRNTVELVRKTAKSQTNQLDDSGLTRALRHAERFAHEEPPERVLEHTFLEPYPECKVWSDATYQQTAEQRAELMRRLVGPAAKAGMLSAGYVEVSAHGRASMEGDTVWYYPYTLAQCSVTVRAPDGTGSGWAGVDHTDWARIDVQAIAQTALDKCLRSRNPVRVEPGRYTAILEPQAVCDLCAPLFGPHGLDRQLTEWGDRSAVESTPAYRDVPKGNPNLPLVPFGKGGGVSKLRERVIDERLTVSTDPTDPELGYPPFHHWQVFRPVTWIKDGVLKGLAYDRAYAVVKLGQNTGGLLSTGSFRINATGTGTGVSVEEMIATTKRGVLVTRFWGVPEKPLDWKSFLLTGYTRDGLWLIEDGKITKAIKNFRFSDSPVYALNNVEQIGVPKRVFHPRPPAVARTSDYAPIPPGYAPVMVPALKVRDFNFIALTDAV